MRELVHLRGSCALLDRGAPEKLFCSAIFGDRARELGWKTAIVSAGPNLLLDLRDQVADSSLATNASVGVHAGFVSAKVDVVPKESSLRKLLSSAAKSSKGLLLPSMKFRTPRLTICVPLRLRFSF